MSIREYTFDDVKDEAQLAFDRWEIALAKLRSGFNQRSCEEMYRSTHELKHLCKVYNLGLPSDLLQSLATTVGSIQDRRIKVSEKLLDALSRLHDDLKNWILLGQIPKDEELDEALKGLHGACILRGLTKRFPKEESDNPWYRSDQILEELLAAEKVSEQQIQMALRLQRRTLIDILKDQGHISDDDITGTYDRAAG
ncbi:hypothetical protein [Pseudobacteriovorax antillogorgiicola]|uniref:Hpt domain-containing protein n=1 Tax=Pseudobacteriovorax antillogorgiicola TaxID=1513793 RepID=A0A1Y6CFN8_9BACT|nr:hypothetical protein [Pseudobacteriovorax antillogorgiicola]TCS47301.1 hypothetical protein EDD56_12176 [Pseudobacteriovorax antillogorgiicola]SMF62516.1 hypothetical protein SAMN06296036_12176 [Pseudobacteriovorax antillogorgiicola]